MKILKREYDISVENIKGYEKLESDKIKEIKKCKLYRFIVVLDESQYIINNDGYPEMTRTAQEEYDDFVNNIRERIIKDNIKIIEEGYGLDEDELDWHITVCYINPEDEQCIDHIIEFDTCVRTEETDE
ncbi:hypothetical protein SAMN02910369_01685 [Lachnospiraceae bacterium NE2001]|nr:hypothetical protein SAMN02910369_01685 [Lachnospiraceae bacterium NE2001]